MYFNGKLAEVAGVSPGPRSLCSGGKNVLGFTAPSSSRASVRPHTSTVFPDLTLTGSEVGLSGWSGDNCLGWGLKLVSGQTSPQTRLNQSESRLESRTEQSSPEPHQQPKRKRGKSSWNWDVSQLRVKIPSQIYSWWTILPSDAPSSEWLLNFRH